MDAQTEQRLVKKGAERQYRIRSLGSSSQQFGLCEVCGKWCSEVHLQAYDLHLNGSRFAGNSCFGHYDCLTSNRKEE